MDPKSTVVKSKSSNSAISKKSQVDIRKQYNKMSRSNADFPPHGLRKRGVYVEKRLTKTNLVNNDQKNDSLTHKRTSVPRPGQKKFLDSVLTILSKSTAGTQYPEDVVDTKKLNTYETDKCSKKKTYMKRSIVKNKLNKHDKADDIKNISRKYKSRVLSKKITGEDKTKMLVLQSQREIVQTPSNYSEWSNKDASQTSNNMLYDDSYKKGEGLNIADELRNALLEGRNVKPKKLRYLEDEPKTLVSDTPKVQKNLYNFFVDLLETTISVYNVKAEYDKTVPSDVSNTELQINESVASKLNVKKVKIVDDYDDILKNQQQLQNIQNETDLDEDFVNKKTKPVTPKPLKQEKFSKNPQRIRLRADSFVQSIKTKTIPHKSKSVEMSRKKLFKHKNDFINVLKQELELDTNRLEEPRSIFQALKLMARNKKKISFEMSVDDKNFTDECLLKRRKVISSRKVKKNNTSSRNNKIRKLDKGNIGGSFYSEISKKKYQDKVTQDYTDTETSESRHSLEVYEYDYVSPNRSYCSKPRDISLTCHSSPSNSELNFGVKHALLNPASVFDSIRKFSAT